MKHLIFMLLFSSTVFAEYIEISPTIFIDPSTLKIIDENTRRISSYYNNDDKDNLGLGSVSTYFEIDCKNESYRILTSSGYSGINMQNLVREIPVDSDKIEYAKPKSIMMVIIRYGACL